MRLSEHRARIEFAHPCCGRSVIILYDMSNLYKTSIEAFKREFRPHSGKMDGAKVRVSEGMARSNENALSTWCAPLPDPNRRSHTASPGWWSALRGRTSSPSSQVRAARRSTAELLGGRRQPIERGARGLDCQRPQRIEHRGSRLALGRESQRSRPGGRHDAEAYGTLSQQHRVERPDGCREQSTNGVPARAAPNQ